MQEDAILILLLHKEPCKDGEYRDYSSKLKVREHRQDIPNFYLMKFSQEGTIYWVNSSGERCFSPSVSKTNKYFYLFYNIKHRYFLSISSC